jgi:hypothetical protein
MTGGAAQEVERLPCKHQVMSSNLSPTTNNKLLMGHPELMCAALWAFWGIS